MRAPSEREVLAATRRLAEHAEHALGVPSPPDLAQPAAAARHLRAIADAVPTSDPDPDARAIVLNALDLERELRRHLVTRRASRRAALARALDRLRAVRDPAELLNRACPEALRGCGARRAMLAAVSEGTWSLTAMAPDQPAPALTAWRHIALSALPLEANVTLRRRPVLVARPDEDRRIHPLLRELGDAPFVLAPIAPADEVIGLLHLDRAGEARPVDDDDRDVAWAFAEGFGRIYERAVFRERLREQRDLVRRAAQRHEQQAPEPDAIIELLPASRRAGAAGTTRDTTVTPGLLTNREREVAELMAEGLSNEQIGQRLVIAPATAKSHIRTILRKLGVTNRSQAIGIYLQLGRHD